MGFEREKNIGSWRDRNSLNPRFEWNETNARNRDIAKKGDAYVLKSYYSMARTITENILRKRYFFDTRFTEKFCRPLLVYLRFYSEVFCESQIDLILTTKTIKNWTHIAGSLINKSFYSKGYPNIEVMWSSIVTDLWYFLLNISGVVRKPFAYDANVASSAINLLNVTNNKIYNFLFVSSLR